MLLYRLEMKESFNYHLYLANGEVSHKGVYHAHYAHLLISNDDYDAGNDSKHPSPQEDMKLARYWNSFDITERESYLFGFTSLEQLRRWFAASTDASDDIKEVVQLAVYQTPELIEGSFQAIAKAENMTLVDILELDYLS